jgi:hypothetical protein
VTITKIILKFMKQNNMYPEGTGLSRMPISHIVNIDDILDYGELG